jgi:hypothetical protein
MKHILDKRTDFQKYLFIRGFLITEENLKEKKDKFPFYSNWENYRFGKYNFLIHNKQNIYYREENNKTYFIIGHAYNPFNMNFEEMKILENIALADSKGKNKLIDKINELTGVFIFGYSNFALVKVLLHLEISILFSKKIA